MSVFDRMFVFILRKRIFGKGGDELAARKAELRGDLARAAQLWAEADRLDEVARVMLLRGDAETDPRQRLQHYTQAVAVAPEGHAARRLARKKRAQVVVAMAAGGAASATMRQDLLEAAAELEEIGEMTRAAEAYALAGDVEGEARALAQAGDVDKLEDLLSNEHARDRGVRRRREAHGEIDMLVACGRRREALAMCDAFAKEQPDDALVKERAHTLRARAVRGPIASLLVHGKKLDLALGAEVVIGRTEGTLTVPSQAISRQHLRIRRDDAGAAIVQDLGSRNGTELRGMRIAGPIPIGAGLELRLGGEVPIVLAPSAEIEGAIAIDLGGVRHVAPLGPARLGVGAWQIEAASDGWLELVTSEAPPALAAGVMLVARVTLLAGDAFATDRGAEPVIRILGGA